MGYLTKEVGVDSQTQISVTLEEDSEALDEVLVIGYAPVKRENVLGALSTVKSESIEQATPVNVFDAIQGQVAGVQILSDGGPGAGFDVRIRGVSTFGGAGTGPLYVVDGQQLDDIDNLNPDDIKSLEIIKDGATAAIYGSKAANEVVIITTKNGRPGELSVDERARELFIEELRMMTLMRMDKLVERVRKYNPLHNGTYADHEIFDYQNLWPIPNSEIERNTEADLEQNPGY